MKHKKLEILGQLLGCYFHQDWLHEFDSNISVIHTIVESESAEQLARGVEEIDDILATSLSEDDLEKVINGQVGCYFDPVSDGVTYEIWLKQVREKFLLKLESSNKWY